MQRLLAAFDGLGCPMAYSRPPDTRAGLKEELMDGHLQDRGADFLRCDDAALPGQMIEAAQVPGWDTAKRLLVEIHSSFKAACRAYEQNDRQIAWKEAYATEKKI
jgi:hypothetical protein